MQVGSTRALEYAKPSMVTGGPPIAAVMVIALLIPGMAGWMMTGRSGARRFILLMVALISVVWLFCYAWPSLPLPASWDGDNVRAPLFFGSLIALVAASVWTAVCDWRTLRAGGRPSAAPVWLWWSLMAMLIATVIAGILLALMAMLLAVGFSAAK